MTWDTATRVATAKRIPDANLDRMAGEGLRFTSAYAGAPLCAPCRGTLMTGMHNGHCLIRQNPSQARGYDAPPKRSTAAGQYPHAGKVLNKPATAPPSSVNGPGPRRRRGQSAVAWFRLFLWLRNPRRRAQLLPERFSGANDQKVALDGKTYSHDLFTKEALDYVRQHREDPFFLYLAFTLPHGRFEPPSDEPYGQALPKVEKAYAAMIHRLDASIGKLLALLKE